MQETRIKYYTACGEPLEVEEGFPPLPLTAAVERAEDLGGVAPYIRFIEYFNRCAVSAHDIAKSKGWWQEGGHPPAEFIALCHSELSEALEAMRDGDAESEKIPEFTGVEEELADVIIRIMDYATGHDLRIPEAVLAKMRYNAGRSYRHGNKAF